MDPGTGRLYPSRESAVAAGVLDPVGLLGSPEAVRAVSAAVARGQRVKRDRARSKAARRARRANR